MSEGGSKTPRKIQCPQFSYKSLVLNVNLLGHLHCGIEQWPNQDELVKVIFFQIFWWDTGA